ncbi:MAG: hypothetical protein AAGK30_01565 [Pseudomonadota bacterium]
MGGLNAVLATRIKFGTTPDTVPSNMRGNAIIALLFGPLIYGAALTQLPNPFAPFQGLYGPGITVMSYTGVALMLVLTGVAFVLLQMGRALGVLLIFPAFVYFSTMIGAVMIAVVPVGSLTLLLGTLALAAWSLFGLWRVHRQIPEATIQALRRERLFFEQGQTYLLPATALEGGGLASSALKGLRSTWALVFEFAGALVLVLFGAVLVPVAIATDLGSQGVLAPIIWFVAVSLFLVARGPVNTLLLLVRVMAEGPATPDTAAKADTSP